MIHPQLALPLSLSNEPSLHNFIVGQNGEAMAQVTEVARGEFSHAALYLWGAAGVGKTHVLSSLALLPHSAWLTPQVLDGQNYDETARIYVLDNVHLLDAAQQKALFHLYNHVRAHKGTVLVLAADVAPAHLPVDFLPDLKTRLAWDLVYQLHALTDEDKAQVLQQRAQERGLSLSADVVPYMLRHLTRDLSQLNNFLQHLDTYSLERQRALTLPLLKEWLHDEHN
ncbi:DnaA regulatory inactivator Hda [Hydromonas duriensis]|uniref:Regulatory inactivation of DnaA Hda protein n=1 Tax=Hydromonas duriensis TaxID=1527608 RepID=A0A4R6YAX0_9BURK|nr:DnaA regulatory inactivator Hda [Hydromonas duriensis]TDR32764.1 regulatory inactivation of DnaA Hda protein [Hydromonas duriensis]